MDHTRATALIDSAEGCARRLRAAAADYRSAGRADIATNVDRLAAQRFAQAVGIALWLDGIHAGWTASYRDSSRPGVSLPAGYYIPTRPAAQTAAVYLDGQRVGRVTLNGSDSARYVAARIADGFPDGLGAA